MALAYMNEINALKQKISEELSRLLDTINTPSPSVRMEKGKGDEVIAKMTQLYYLNLLQINNIKTLSSVDKEKVKQDILKNYKKNLMRAMYYAGK